MQTDQGISENTNIEIWRRIRNDYYSPSIHVTKFGDIGINVGGYVLVAPIESWHEAGIKILAVDSTLPSWKHKLGYWLLGWNKRDKHITATNYKCICGKTLNHTGIGKVSFQDGDCPIANCQSFDTTHLGLYKGYDYWKCNSCKATWKTKSKGN